MTANGQDLFRAYLKDLGDLVTGGQVLPAWSPDGSRFGFVEGPADNRKAWSVDLSTGAKTPLFDVDQVRASIAAATGEEPPGHGVPFAHFGFVAPQMIAFQIGEHALVLDLASGQATRQRYDDGLYDQVFGAGERARSTPRPFSRTQPLVDPIPAVEVMSPDAKFFLSTDDHNIALRSTADGRTVRLTDDGTAEHEYRFDLTNPMLAAMGLAVPTTNWSPDGSRIAVYKVDNRGVAALPQVHYLKRDDEVVHRYHAKAGGTLEKYTLQVLDVYGRPGVEIDLGDTRDTYPIFAGWLPDGSEVLVFQLSRDCRKVNVLAANPNSGAVRKLFQEEGKTFIRIHHDIYFGRKLGLVLTPDGKHLIWTSDRSGWKHFYLYDLEGNLVRQLTDGEWPVDQVTKVVDGFVYFTGRRDQGRPYDLHLYRVPLDGGEVEALTDAQGVHSIAIAPTGSAFLDTHSTSDQAPVVELRRIDGTFLAEVTRADTSKLEAIGYTAPEQFTVKAADGTTDLWGVLFKPHDFDPAKRYALVEYIYGGAQLAVGPHGFAGPASPFGIQAQAIAQLGYITVVLDARGTPERSKAFHDASYGRWANCLADDHAEALKQLAARHSFIDLERVGITGGSWGAYSAFRCLADRPDVYKAAVAISPGFDPYSSVLYECYLGLPQDNRAGYEFASTYPRAANLQGELLLACGTSDHATWTDAVKMTEALIRAGKQHEFIVMPGQFHGYDNIHDLYLWKKAGRFFADNLGAPVAAPEPEAVLVPEPV